MRAVVLVGGEGTRLRPLTYHVPKPMLPVGGVGILERVLARLADHGVTEAALSLGYKPDAFVHAFPTGVVRGIKLKYAVEETPLDTAGAIAFAARQAGFESDAVVVANGDILTDGNISALLQFHKDCGAKATIALTPVEDPSRFGVVPTFEDGRVKAFIEKPKASEAPTNLINAGTYILEPEVFELIPEGARLSIERQVFPQLVEIGSLFAMRDDAYWIDAGTPQALLQASFDILAGKRAASASNVTGSWMGTEVNPGPKFHNEFSAVSDGALIGANVSLVRSIVLGNAVIGDNVTIEDSIVAGTVASGANVSDFSVIGVDGKIETNESVKAEKRPL